MSGKSYITPEGAEKLRAELDRLWNIEDEAGGQRRYRLVGPDEIDPARGFISIDSPLGQELIGKGAGAEVHVERPAGTTSFTVLAVGYDGSETSDG